MRTTIFNDKRILISLLFLGLLVVLFWTGSRYPALNEKAAMAGDTPIAGIAFDILLEITPNTSFWAEVLANTVNWVYTNWKGMTFGVLFGAALATLIPLVPRRSFDNSFGDAVLGAAIGAPLGVCVNCAAPVAHAMYSAGASRATTLATLVASPTLNVIVVSMSFAILPAYIAWTRLALIVLVLLVGIPLLCKLFPETASKNAVAKPSKTVSLSKAGWLTRALQARTQARPEDYFAEPALHAAALWFARRFVSNLAFVCILTVPLMLVAGFLGALTITALPLSALSNVASQFGGGVVSVIAVMTAIAVIALVLPVPIAFDIVLVSVLWAAGWPPHYIMVALIALGMFSIYSFLIIGRVMSFRIAGSMMVMLFFVAVGGGIMAGLIKPYAEAGNWQRIAQILETAPQTLRVPVAAQAPVSTDTVILKALAQTSSRASSTLEGAVVRHEGEGSIAAQTVQLSAVVPTSPEGPPFKRLHGAEIGLTLENPLSTIRMFDVFAYFTPIAAGDVNGDGWEDLAVGADVGSGGAALFVNTGGEFLRKQLDLGPINTSYVVSLALVDLNNDGAPDIFASSFLDGAFVFWNDGAGNFSPENRMLIPNGDAIAMVAPSFSDLDGDGDLDGFAGNWIGGHLISFISDYRSADRIFWNEGAQGFVTQELPGVPGETLSTLITDVNADGRPDILVGNDIGRDTVYLNEGGRRFSVLRREAGTIPWMGQSTMSLDVGDFDNDQKPDIYIAQVTHGNVEPLRADGTAMGYCDPDMARFHGEDEQCGWTSRDRSNGFMKANVAAPRCDDAMGAESKSLCAVRTTLMQAAKANLPADCASLPNGWPYLGAFCGEVIAGSHLPDSDAKLIEQDALPWLADRNILLRGGARGAFVDVAPALGAKTPGWSWNAKFTDLDQDGWQDIFVATGYIVPNEHSPNAYYRNLEGERFVHASNSFGLADRVPTSAFVLSDYDRDGDVDIIRAPVAGAIIVQRNDRPSGAGIWISLKDQIGNARGIGAVITIHTDDQATPVQRREVKASGGFASFDAPKAHFGLGAANRVSKVEIKWPDGGVSALEGSFAANSELSISRK